MLFGSYQLYSDYSALYGSMGSTPVGIQQSVYSRLTSKTGYDVYPYKIPQGKPFPCMTYSLVTNLYGHNLEGSDTTSLARLQIDCWSYNYSEALTMAESVRNSFQGFQGVMGDNGVGVLSCIPAGRQTFYQEPGNDSDQGYHHIALDYSILYRVDRSSFTWVAGPTLEGSYIESAVVGLISALGLATVYASRRPQKSALPSIVFLINGMDQPGNLSGAAGFATASYTITCYGTSISVATDLADNIRLALDGLSGNNGGIYMYGNIVESSQGDYIEPSNDSDFGTYAVTLNCSCLYQELLPVNL